MGKETNQRIYISCLSRGQCVEMVLRKGLGLSPAFISHLKYVPGGILRNGSPARTVDTTTPGDTVSARIDDPEGRNPAAPEDCGVKILYEDEYLAVLNKPSGVSTHGSTHSVAANVALFWGPESVFHPVNRLDTGTSGLMVAAKCRLVHGLLQKQLHTEKFVRNYVAIVEGVLFGSGRVTRPVGGKDAVTVYRAHPLPGGLSYVELQLLTGRTHQIREHMAALGHPLAGDLACGGSPARIARPALHSFHVRFFHPIRQEFCEFRQELPPDIKSLLQEQKCLSAEN